jgi:signal transduction histidine kinase
MGMVGLQPPIAHTIDRQTGRPAWPGVLAVVVTVMAATASVVSTGLAPDAPVGESGLPLALSWAAVPCLVVLVAACWILVADHPRSAVGFSLVAGAWLLPGLAAWPLPSAQVRAALLAAPPLAVAGIALVTAGWRPSPTDRPTSQRVAVALATAAAVTHLVGYDPFFDPACARTCEASPAVLADLLGQRQVIGVSVGLTLLASTAAVVASLRSRSAPKSLRAAGVLAAALFALAAFLSWWGWGGLGTPAIEDLLQTLGSVAIVAAAFAMALHTRSVRRHVRDVVEHLADSTSVRGLGASVTAVHFAVADDGRWVDLAGHEVGAAEPRRCAILSDAHGPAVRLVLSGWAEPDQVLSSIAPAGRLALENARLSAAGLVRIADVQASQRRIVEATDLERRRIERDLHDGAQQRLVAVAMHLSSARQRSGAGTSNALIEGEAHVREALAALRELSHDSLIAVLGAEGLEAGIEELVAACPLRVDVHLALTARPLPQPVQMAAYLTVAAGLDNVVAHTRTDRAWVFVVQEAETLIIRVVDAGLGGAVVGRGLTAVADRVGALGGTFDLASDPQDGTTVTTRLRCGS